MIDIRFDFAKYLACRLPVKIEVVDAYASRAAVGFVVNERNPLGLPLLLVEFGNIVVVGLMPCLVAQGPNMYANRDKNPRAASPAAPE